MGCSTSSNTHTVKMDTLAQCLNYKNPVPNPSISSLTRDEKRQRVTFANLNDGVHIKVPGFTIYINNIVHLYLYLYLNFFIFNFVVYV